MKYPIFAAALLIACAAPAAAMTIDPDERVLYDASIRCMVYFGVMGGMGGDGPRDQKMVDAGNKFVAVAIALADGDQEQTHRDFAAELDKLHELTRDPGNPVNIQQVRDIAERCQAMERLVDAMAEGSN